MTFRKTDLIPSESDWAQSTFDPDVGWLCNLFLGKSHAEVQKHFSDGNFTERMSELLHAPRPVFQYYIQSAGMYAVSTDAIKNQDASAASAFLNTLLTREEKDKGSVKEICLKIAPFIEFIALHQQAYDAPIEIFGDFMEIHESIKEKLNY